MSEVTLPHDAYIEQQGININDLPDAITNQLADINNLIDTYEADWQNDQNWTNLESASNKMKSDIQAWESAQAELKAKEQAEAEAKAEQEKAEAAAKAQAEKQKQESQETPQKVNRTTQQAQEATPPIQQNQTVEEEDDDFLGNSGLGFLKY